MESLSFLPLPELRNLVRIHETMEQLDIGNLQRSLDLGYLLRTKDLGKIAKAMESMERGKIGAIGKIAKEMESMERGKIGAIGTLLESMERGNEGNLERSVERGKLLRLGELLVIGPLSFVIGPWLSVLWLWDRGGGTLLVMGPRPPSPPNVHRSTHAGSLNYIKNHTHT